MTLQSILNVLYSFFINDKQVKGVLQQVADSKKEQLQVRVSALTQEASEVQAKIGDWISKIAQYEQATKAALLKIDLESDENAALDAAKYRILRDSGVSEIEKLKRILAEFPDRIKVVKAEIELIEHRERVVEFNAILKDEVSVYLAYERAALGLLDAYADMRAKRDERAALGEQVANYARAHGMPFPSGGINSFPTPDPYWADTSLAGYIRGKFAETRKELVK